MSDAAPAGPPAKNKQFRDTTRGERREVQGLVVSTKMQKTIIVETERMVRHPKYKKFIRRHSRVYAHDEKGDAKVGDLVRVTEARPLSKLKRFTLTTVVKRVGEA